MTTKNKAQLLASFPDNNSGLITPPNMRDFVDSVELKYSNFTVVKPGQPLGNAFPDPVAGKITLPAGSVFAINGDVTVNYPLFFEDSASVISLSGLPTVDRLKLDASAGAVALINVEGDGKVVSLSDLFLSSGAGSGRIFDAVNPASFRCTGCVLIGENLGSIAMDGTGESDFTGTLVYASGASPLQFTGTSGRLVFNGVRSGVLNGANQFDLTGIVSEAILITGCYNASGFDMFSAVEGSTPRGLVSNNIAADGSGFISGVDETLVNWIFSGNSGLANIVPMGALSVRGNSDPTVISGADTFVPVTGASVIAGSVTRFESPSDSALKYIGKSGFKGVATVSVSLNNPDVSLPYDYSVSLFKNGSILEDGGISYAASAIIGEQSKQTLSFSAPISAILDDVFEVVVSSTTGSQSPIVEDLTFSIS